MNAIKFFYFIFGALTLVGGIMGYVKAQSTASLIAGGLSGLLLIVAGAMFTNNQQNAAILGLIVSLVLVVFFGRGLLTTAEGKTDAQVKSSRGRAIPMLVLGSVGVVLSALVLFKR